MEREELKALTLQITLELQRLDPVTGWYADINDENHHSQRIKAKADHAVLYVSTSHYGKGRVSIDGSLNVGKNGQYVRVYQTAKDGSGWHEQRVQPISVAVSRGPSVIAKETLRRFLPEYLRILDLALDQVSKENNYLQARQAARKRLQIAAGKIPDVSKEDDRQNFHISIGEVYGDVDVSDKTASIHLRSLTVEQAEKVLRMVRNGELR